MQEWQGEKKGLYHKRESFGRSVSSQEPHAWESLDQSQLQLLLGQPWVFGQESHSVVNWPWRASLHCRAHMWILTSSGHRGDPSLPGLLEANCVQPGAQGCGSKSWDADSSVSTAKRNWAPCLNNLLSKQPHRSLPEGWFIFWSHEGGSWLSNLFSASSKIAKQNAFPLSVKLNAFPLFMG